MTSPWKPTREQLAAAANQHLADVWTAEVKGVFVGINPSLYSAAIGRHFGRPGNRFWKALHAAGFTDRLLSPFEERELLKSGYGITNVVPRATATANQVTKEDFVNGGRRLVAKVLRYRPKFLAIVGLGAYRAAFNRPKAIPGRQNEEIGDTILWVLPNPSGLNANYQQTDLVRLFKELKAELDRIE